MTQPDPRIIELRRQAVIARERAETIVSFARLTVSRARLARTVLAIQRYLRTRQSAAVVMPTVVERVARTPHTSGAADG